VELQDYLAQKPERTSGRRDFLISREKRLNLPSAPGVYRYIDRSGRILYVGKATSLKSRVNSYFTGGCRGDHRKLEMLAQAVDIEVTTTVAPIYAGLLEYDEIRRLKPPYNIAFKGQGRDPLKPLDLLSGVLADFNPSRHAGVIKDTFYDLDDMETLREGIALWRLQSMIRPEQPLVPRQLLNLGLPLLKKWITEEKERRLMLQQDLEQELVEDVEEDDSAEAEEEICWTREMVADHCRRIIRRATRHFIRSKWLLRLSESTIQLSLTESSRGKRKKNANVLTINPSGQTGAFDFRRVRILVHELRRAESKGAAWQVIKPWPMAVPFWI
jgi:DNA polymerase-3 subunit epsilon